ncbi:MAG: MarR family transcriptional regulator [Planctomycetia bacterium]|nr:MarR family transcriptional regulator [Planctomycetia bacterium]
MAASSSANVRATRTPRRASKFDSLEQEAYLQLWRTYDRLKMLEDRLFDEVEISAQQYNTLRLLRSVRPKTMPTSALAVRLVSRAPDMTRLLDKLEERGLVRRERKAANRRVVEVGIAESGVALLDALAERVRRCHAEQLGHLGAKALRELIGVLKEVRRPHEDEASLWPGNQP